MGKNCGMNQPELISKAREKERIQSLIAAQIYFDLLLIG